MKIAYLTYSETNQLDGSRLKYSRLIAHALGKAVVRTFFCVGTSASGALKEFKPDLIVCHGDWVHHYRIAIEMGVPYVLVQHDVMSMRRKLRPPEVQHELEMLQAAVGVIFTSEEHAEYCTGQYKIPHGMVVHLRPSLVDLDFEPLPKLPGRHLVYAGGILPKRGLVTAYGYRVYHEIFAKAIKYGWTVHVYPNLTCLGNAEEYEAMGCKIHGSQPYAKLLQLMSQYTAGFQGYNKNGTKEASYAYTQACRPNKTWDYLAAGIPTVGFNMGRTAQLYVEGGWGVTIETLEEFANVHERLPVVTQETRQREVIEADTERVREFFHGVLLRTRKRNKQQELPGPNGRVPLIAKHQLLREREMIRPGKRFFAWPWEAGTLVTLGKARYLHPFELEGLQAEMKPAVENETQEEVLPIW